MLLRFYSFLLLLTLCSSSSLQAQDKIIGGGPVSGNIFPWSAALVRTSASPNNRTDYLCGGVLVHPQIVMTAAHCIFPFAQDSSQLFYHTRPPLLPHEFSVVLNTADLTGAAATRHTVSDVMVHPDFFERNDRSLLNDVALIRLDSPVSSPWLPLATDPARFAPGTLATVAGWGTVSTTTATYPNRLQAVDVPIVSNAVAANQLFGVLQIEPSMLAAGFGGGGKDACQGDSGGPLMVPGPNAGAAGLQLAGLVSFGDGCAQPNNPGVYTRVLSFRPWASWHLFPEIMAWEQANGVTGLMADPDGDGLVNLHEFATGSPPNIFNQDVSVAQWLDGPPALGLRTRYRTDIPWITFKPQRSADLQTWSDISFTGSFDAAPTSLNQNLSQVTLRDPIPAASAPLGFLRLNVDLANAPSARIQARALQTGRLFFDEPTNAAGQHQDTFELVNIPSGINGIQFTMESTTFDPYLYLVDLDSGQVLASNDNGGAGNSAVLILAPVAGIRYGIGASANAPNVTGSYILESETF